LANINQNTTNPSHNSQLGRQRDWIWRGWQIRYTSLPPQFPTEQTLPILFLHGFGAQLGQWRRNLLPLSKRHRIYGLDFLGFGGSQKAPANYSIPFWAELVYDFWQTWIGEPVVIVGHSLGSAIALRAVADFPHMARGLAMVTLPQVEPAPRWVQGLVNILATPITIFPILQLARQPWFLRRSLLGIYQRRELVDQELVDLFATPPRDRGTLGVLTRLVRASSQPSYGSAVAPLLAHVGVPILLLWGKCDRVVPLASVRPYLQQNPRVQLVEIDGGGHCVYDEQAEIVNQTLQAWLERELFPTANQQPRSETIDRDATN
jgi:pimeloyl-ACP methyl ester carboxylesterase